MNKKVILIIITIILFSALLITKLIIDTEKGKKIEITDIGQPGIILYIDENPFYEDMEVALNITTKDSTLTITARYHKRPVGPDEYLALKNAEYLELDHLAKIFFLPNEKFLNHLALTRNDTYQDILKALKNSEVRIKSL